jgi:hypothetical protein
MDGPFNYEPVIRDMTWSYSRVKCYSDCPYRFYLKYIRFPRGNWDVLFFQKYGNFMHSLLEEYFSGAKNADEIRISYLSEFAETVPFNAPNQILRRNYFHDGLAYMNALEPPKHRVVAVEERANIEIGGVPFVGIIDLLEETDDGQLILIDHKSRALKPRSKRKGGAKSDRVLDEYLRQLYLYSEFVKQSRGQYPAQLCFNCFRTQSFIEEPFSMDAKDEAVGWLLSEIDKIAKDDEFCPDLDWFKCTYLCEAHRYCEYCQLRHWG